MALNCCCGKRRQQQPQPFQLLRVQDAVEQLEVVAQPDDLALRHVAQVGARGEEDRRRKLGHEMVGQIEVEIEPRQVAILLLLDLVDMVLGKQHSAFRMIGMRQRQEALRPEPFLADFLGRHVGQFLPRPHSLGQFHPDALLHRLAAGHRHALGRLVAQVVALVQQRGLPLLDRRLGRLHFGHGLCKRLLHDDRCVAGGGLLLRPCVHQDNASQGHQRDSDPKELRTSHSADLRSWLT